MAGWLAEPGFIAAMVMLGATALQAIGAMLAREDYMRLAQLAVDVAEDPDVSTEEKQDLAFNIRMVTAWFVGPLMFIGFPLMTIYLVFKAAAIALSGGRVTEATLLGSFKKQSKYADIVNKPIWKARPLFMAWAVLWMLPLLVTLLLTQGSKSLISAILNRGPLSMFSRLAHH